VVAVHAIYDQLGLDFSDAFADRMRKYLREKPRDKFGKHRYAAEDYGLTDAGIREHFRFYTDHYGIELEAAV
jgi:hypothetical protein